MGSHCWDWPLPWSCSSRGVVLSRRNRHLGILFKFFSDVRLKCDDKLKILPWAVCRASGLLQCQHLPARPPDPVLEGGSGERLLLPPRCLLFPSPPRPHCSLLKLGVKPWGSSPIPSSHGGLGHHGCCAPAWPWSWAGPFQGHVRHHLGVVGSKWVWALLKFNRAPPC